MPLMAISLVQRRLSIAGRWPMAVEWRLTNRIHSKLSTNYLVAKASSYMKVYCRIFQYFNRIANQYLFSHHNYHRFYKTWCICCFCTPDVNSEYAYERDHENTLAFFEPLHNASLNCILMQISNPWASCPRNRPQAIQSSHLQAMLLVGSMCTDSLQHHRTEHVAIKCWSKASTNWPQNEVPAVAGCSTKYRNAFLSRYRTTSQT